MIGFSTAFVIGTVAGGVLVFAYAKYGGLAAGLTPLPAPAAVLGPVATLTLADATVDALLGAS